MMKLENHQRLIRTKPGGFVSVDQVDEYLETYEWTVYKGYARRVIGKDDDQNLIYQLLHHAVMENMLGTKIPDDRVVDHIDRNRGNNTRNNLRLATYSENRLNVSIQCNNTTGYKGVTLHKTGYYVSYLGVRGKRVYLGQYTDPLIAARVYDAAIRHFCRDYGIPNFPDEQTTPEAQQMLERMINRKGQRNSKSRFYGVSCKPHGWTARVGSAKTCINIGTFKDEESAARAVDAYVKQHNLNKPRNFPDE